jgi:uncharacterized membrane protein
MAFVPEVTRKQAIILSLTALLASVYVDTTLAPVLLHRWVSLHCLPAVVIFVGIRFGSWPGVGVGWLGAALFSALTGASVAQEGISLGVVGYLAGLTRYATALVLPLVDVLAMTALLFLENLLAAGVVLCFSAGGWRTDLPGVIATALLAAFYLIHHPIGVEIKQEQMIRGHKT